MRGPSPFRLQGLCHPGLAGTAVPRTTIVGLFSLYNLVNQFRHGHSVADARFWMSVFHSSNVVFDRRMLAGCMGCTWLAAYHWPPSHIVFDQKKTQLRFEEIGAGGQRPPPQSLASESEILQNLSNWAAGTPFSLEQKHTNPLSSAVCMRIAHAILIQARGSSNDGFRWPWCWIHHQPQRDSRWSHLQETTASEDATTKYQVSCRFLPSALFKLPKTEPPQGPSLEPTNLASTAELGALIKNTARKTVKEK
ncbi:predicted protein [Histoplasma capsulatum var. duboisii H88]|uniref:Predicted protein n=1 Tax=Ajellomyces capsulatus (strain H88) TaxID=544711 RepID=F0UFJ6_AJEC8|nr:predicted protein [Histoplasma capsulatum var. duboisii H88]